MGSIARLDTNSPESTFHPFTPNGKSHAFPLYYAALCGFRDLVEHLMIINAEHMNAIVIGGHCVAPLIAALKAGHLQTAKFLRDKRISQAMVGKLHCILQPGMEISR